MNNGTLAEQFDAKLAAFRRSVPLPVSPEGAETERITREHLQAVDKLAQFPERLKVAGIIAYGGPRISLSFQAGPHGYVHVRVGYGPTTVTSVIYAMYPKPWPKRTNPTPADTVAAIRELLAAEEGGAK